MKVWYDDNEEEIPLIDRPERIGQALVVGGCALAAFVLIVAVCIGGCA